MGGIKKASKKASTLDKIVSAANNDAPPSLDEMKHISIRLHPDLLRRIQKYAESDNRMFSETVRDLLVTGMRERGI